MKGPEFQFSEANGQKSRNRHLERLSKIMSLAKGNISNYSSVNSQPVMNQGLQYEEFLIRSDSVPLIQEVDETNFYAGNQFGQ